MPTWLFLIKPLIFRIRPRHHIQVLVAVHSRIVELVIVTSDEPVLQKLFP